MVLNTELTKTLNAQATIPKVLVGTASNAAKGSAIISTTYIIESGGYLFIKVFETGTDVASGDADLKITMTNTFQAQFNPSTTLSTTSFVGAGGIAMATYAASSPLPVDTICKITVGASVSTTSDVNYSFELSELITGIYR